MLARFADEMGFLNLSWYIDNVESGVTLDRPAMNRLISDMKAGIVHTVAVIGYDRIARGFGIMSEWIRLLHETDVRCVSPENGGQDIRGGFIALNELLNTLAHKYAR